MLSKIMAYEAGELDEDEVVALFQSLVSSGLAWQLQGHYGRVAADLIDAGHVTVPAVTAQKSEALEAKQSRLLQKLLPDIAVLVVQDAEAERIRLLEDFSSDTKH